MTGKEIYLDRSKDEWVDFRVIAKDSFITIYFDGYKLIDTQVNLPYFQDPELLLASRTGAYHAEHNFKDISIKILEQVTTNINFIHNPDETILEIKDFELYELDTDSLKIKIDGEDVIFKDKTKEGDVYIVKLGYKDNKILESKSKHTIIMEWKEKIGVRKIEKEFAIISILI